MAKKTQLPYVPPTGVGKLMPALDNAEAHYKIYIDLRKMLSEECNLRRARQWEMLKWVSTILLAVNAGMFAFFSKSSERLGPTVAFGTTLMLVALSLLAVLRILHDAGQQSALSESIQELDANFGIKFPDGKLTTQIDEWCKNNGYDYGWAHVLCSFRCTKKHGSKLRGYSFIVKCYLNWIGLLTAFALCLVGVASVR
jgi:hypothetical protein